MQEEKILRNA